MLNPICSESHFGTCKKNKVHTNKKALTLIIVTTTRTNGNGYTFFIDAV